MLSSFHPQKIVLSISLPRYFLIHNANTVACRSNLEMAVFLFFVETNGGLLSIIFSTKVAIILEVLDASTKIHDSLQWLSFSSHPISHAMFSIFGKCYLA